MLGNDRARKAVVWFVMITALAVLCGCTKQPSEPAAERAPTPTVAEKKEAPLTLPPAPLERATPDPKQVSKLPPPKPSEVKDAVQRVFKNVAVVDASRNPYFLVGDFNGDYSQDLAVIIKPAENRLAEMNEEYPPWMLKDPFHPNLPPQLRKEPLRVNANDVLLAVIHGDGPDGWRNPDARQTYLLKDAVGAGINTKPAKQLAAASSAKKVPQLFGDAIAQVLEGTEGFLYYTGAGYAWYDPKTFEPEAQKRIAHPGVSAQR